MMPVFDNVKRIHAKFISFLRRKKLLVLAVFVLSISEILGVVGAGAALFSIKSEPGIIFSLLLLLRIVAFVLIAAWCAIQILERYQKERQEK